MKRKKPARAKPARPTRPPARLSNSPRIIFAAFFLSGLAGLMHQVVWAKLLVQLIGATAYAQVVVLAVFMCGLAFGAYLFGRRSDRSDRPLRSYVILEILIGGYCLALPVLLFAAELGYVSLGSRWFVFSAMTLLLRFLLVAVLILFPAILMGGTLPILARHLIGRVEDTQRQVGKLYALNSFGAVLGAGVAGFLALPLLGIYLSLAIASLFNFASAALALLQLRRGDAIRLRPQADMPASGEDGSSAGPVTRESFHAAQYRVALVALFLSGFAAMGYEVLFIRIISLAFGSSTYSFTVMLMSFITGIAIGSTIVSRIDVRDPLWLFGVSQFMVIAALLLATPLIARMPYLIGLLRVDLRGVALGFELYQLGKALLCMAVLLLPSICLGLGFPLVARIQARHPREIGTRVGSTYAWNTAGNLLGVVVTSLVLLPWLGLRDGFYFNNALNFLAGIALLAVAADTKIRERALAGSSIAAIIAIFLVVGSDWSEPVNQSRNHLRLRDGPRAGISEEALLSYPTSSFAAWKQIFVARADRYRHFFFEEDAHAAVLVVGNGDNLKLYVNSKPDATTKSDLGTQLLLAHAPLLLHPDARTALVVGYGSGITAGSAMRHPLESMDIVEISPAVLSADVMFSTFNYAVLQDPRVQAFVDDAQSFLRTVPRTYDVIISQPPNPWIAGVGGLFTVDYFESVRDRLNPGGVFSFWFHAYEQSDEAVELIARTIGSVFPQVTIFVDGDLGDLVALASMDPIEPDFARMESRYRQPGVRNDLARLGMKNLVTLLSHHRMSPQKFSQLLRPGPLNTVGHQRLEYMAARSFFRKQHALFFDRHDPLVRGGARTTDLLLDRYIAHRAQAGNPVSRDELIDAASYALTLRGYGAQLARSIGARIR